MLITVIKISHYHETHEHLKKASQLSDGIELRLDYLNSLDLDTIAKLRSEVHCPIIFTLRKKSQGGFYPHNENQRLQDILSLGELNPDYFDLEYDIPRDFITEIKNRFPAIKLICSYHNFEETPPDLIAIFESLQDNHFYGYKMATMANKTSDALRMLALVRTTAKNRFFTGLCMGEYGQCTRILSPIFGNAMNYVALDNTNFTAAGQLTLNEILSIYHYRKLNSATKIYALLGDPVEASLGHLHHNKAIEFLNENAVYIKLRVTQDELPLIIDQCRHLPFSGFSITMPLKESITALCDDIESASLPIKAINSLAKIQNKWLGFNTDGLGALDALATQVNIAKQTIAILGAGGAARAIAYEAVQQNAKVIILNRTFSKAKQLADEFGCTAFELNDLATINYTIIINTLPSNVYRDLSIRHLLQENIISKIIAMDIVYQPIHTSFLQIAKQAGCTCVFGYEMFVNQALLQIKRWFDPKEAHLAEIKNKMIQYFSNVK